MLDRATISDPFQRPEGIDYVFVRGECAMDHGQYTGARNGKTIRRA